MKHFSPTLPTLPRWSLSLVRVLATLVGVGSPPALLPLGAQSPARQQPATIRVPGIPNKPDLVTAVPFYWKPNETDDEKTKVVIPAEVDGRRGNFIVDLGAPFLVLNRTFLQPSPTGGVDTVTDANRIPDRTKANNARTWDRVHVTMRIGTLLDQFEDSISPMVRSSNHHSTNAVLTHMWSNFFNFAPRLGNISLSVLEPFETIIDYTHRRVVLIRLDAAGHRMVDVPAYTPKWTAPLIDVGADGSKRWQRGPQWWGIMVRRAPATDTLNEPSYTLDILNAANNTLLRALETGSAENEEDDVAYPFLRHLGVFGFNHRTHQFILYH